MSPPKPRGGTINASTAAAIVLLLITIACTSAPQKTPADILAATQPSIVRIITPNSSGTGFIVSETGLIITNRDVVEGNRHAVVRLSTGEQYEGAVTQLHATLDLAYVEIQSDQLFVALTMGDSAEVSVGQTVIAIGYPLADDLGLAPTVSKGIISAMRDDYLQTDVSINPGNSGGPLLTEDGRVVGLISARAEETETGRAVTGIGFAIPINDVKPGLPVGHASGNPVPGDTPTPTVVPTLAPTPNVLATRAALEADDQRRRAEAGATRIAEQAQQEAERYAASLEATRIAELPTATPTPPPTLTPPPGPTATPTPTPTPEATPTRTPLPPTPTPHPAIFCQEWEGMVLEWVKQGNDFDYANSHYSTRLMIYGDSIPDIPDHPRLSAQDARQYCIRDRGGTSGHFPTGVLRLEGEVGDGRSQYGTSLLLPGLYEYRGMRGDNRLPNNCELRTNEGPGQDRIVVELPHGEPFTFRFFEHHETVGFYCSSGNLYRIGD